jgi:hypothetical protein
MRPIGVFFSKLSVSMLLMFSGLTVMAQERAVIRVEGDFQVGSFDVGALLMLDRTFRVRECPASLQGLNFIRHSIEGVTFQVLGSGRLMVLVPERPDQFRGRNLHPEAFGFTRTQMEPFQLFGDDPGNRVAVYQKDVVEGEVYSLGKYVVFIGFKTASEGVAWSENTGERLYNGIVLPELWPPRNIDPGDESPMPVPYLDHPPEIIPIDIGRQLFVDNFLIAETNLTRTYHKPVKYAGNPVLKPETPMELGEDVPGHVKPYGDGNAGAAPKSGGVWWDPEAQVFRMWYETSWFGPIAMAISKDGLNWERPEFNIRPGTNQVSPLDVIPDSWTVAPNYDAEHPDQRWTLYVQPPGRPQTGQAFTSADGIHWENRVVTGVAGDRSTHFYNPFRKRWIYSIRVGIHKSLPAHPVERGRARLYYETEGFPGRANWQEHDRVVWLMADREDPMDYLTREKPALYNFDAVAYESIMLGMFQMYHGPHNRICIEAGLPKITELNFAYSRDGFHWHRPDRRIHIPAERNDVWDRGYIQSVGGITTIVGDKLYIYYIGFQGNVEKAGHTNGFYDRSATGVAMLRRDGFVSLNAGNDGGHITTRPVEFSGSALFVNADVPDGVLRAEVQDIDGNPIAPFFFHNSVPFSGDSTIHGMKWRGGADLSSLAGQPVRFSFELSNGALYAFWVSADESGRSDGYVAGGGPGYTGPTDTVGKRVFDN